MPGYGNDLAHIHDDGYGGFSRSAAPGLLEHLRRAGIADGLVVDLGCGSGIWARALVDAGYRVLGIDQSKAMIRLAKTRVPEGKFRTASFVDAELPRCRAVTSLGEPLCYLLDDRNGPAPLQQLFRRVFRALEPGGLFLFDIAEPELGTEVVQRHRIGDDWAILVDYERDPKANRFARKMVFFRKHGRGYRRGEEVHWLRLYRAADLADDLRRIGFAVRVRRRYGDFQLPQHHAALIARKR